jgi:hypothetical protein
MPAKMIGPSAPAPSPTATWDAAAPVEVKTAPHGLFGVRLLAVAGHDLPQAAEPWL